MRKLILGIMALAVLSVFAGSVAAQKPKARDLFIEKEQNESTGKSGVKVRILLKRGNENERFVSPSETFYSGDKIKLAFDINFSGYIALLNIGSSGKISILYPYAGSDARVEPSYDEQLIPSNDRDWIKFDDQPGSEKITVVFSSNPLQTIDDVIAMSKQKGVSISANISINTSSAKAQSLLIDLNSRSLGRAKSRDLSIETVPNEATYVVAEPDLISEPTAFIITLRHER